MRSPAIDQIPRSQTGARSLNIGKPDFELGQNSENAFRIMFCTEALRNLSGIVIRTAHKSNRFRNNMNPPKRRCSRAYQYVRSRYEPHLRYGRVNASGGTMPVPVIKKLPQEAVLAIEIIHYVLRFALQLRQSSLACKGRLSAAHDSDLNLDLLGAKHHASAECTVQSRSFRHRPSPAAGRADSLPRYHASSCRSDRVPDNPATAAQHQSQLRLGNRPLGIAADAHFISMPHNAASTRLEEQLRTLCGINAIVEVTSACIFRFFNPCRSAAIVCHSRSPHLWLSTGGRIAASENSPEGEAFSIAARQ